MTKYQEWLVENNVPRSPSLLSSGYLWNSILNPDWTINQEWRMYRQEAIELFGFAIPNNAAIKAIARLSPLLELGAGTGYWTHELTLAGADVVATDPEPFSCCSVKPKPNYPWPTPERPTALEALAKYPGRTPLTVWPSLDDNWATEALEKHAANGGTHFIHVGENGGCTANDNFFDALGLDWEEEETVKIPQWLGIHDAVWIYRRKT